MALAFRRTVHTSAGVNRPSPTQAAPASELPGFQDADRRPLTHARLRVLNIIGMGCAVTFERDLDDVIRARRPRWRYNRRPIIGIKQHTIRPGVHSVERAVEAGTLAGIPVMVDFWPCISEKSLAEL